MSKKRRREQSSIDVQLVEIYDDLANENEEIRFKAAHAFLTKFSLQSNQSRGQLAEAVRRLIRGLCSGRKAARLGFSIALTEFLSQRWGRTPIEGAEELQVSELVDVLIQQTETTSKVSGQEERDHLFGRLFGAEAFIKSGALFQPNASLDTWSQVLDIIYEVAKRKPWLREECGWILYGTSQILKDVPNDTPLVQALVDKLCQNGLAKSPEGIAIWLNVQTDFSEADFPKGIWRDENPLHRKEKSRLGKILKEASTGESIHETKEALLQKGNWTSKIHFVWNVILAKLTTGEPVNGNSTKSKTISFGEFWQEAVDEHLFALSSSEERKYWGFLLFQQLFSRTPEAFLSSLFTDNFKRCLINQLASKDRYLHLAAEKSIKFIFKRVELEPSTAFAPLKAFLATSLHGKLSFDQLTKTKTVERLVSLADDFTACRLVHELCSKLVRLDIQDEEDAAARRQVIADQLVSLLKSRQSTGIPEDSSSNVKTLAIEVLNVLVTYSYFSINPSASDRQKAPSPSFSQKTQDMLRSRLSTCLSHIVDRFLNPALYTYKAVYQVRLNEADKDLHPNLDLTGPVSESISTAWQSFEHIRRSLEQKPSNATSLGAFMLLYSLTILQVYNGDADAVTMLDELQSCYKLLIERQGEDRQQGSGVLIEILLSLVAKPSQLFRRLAQQVFSAFTSDINSNDLQPMIKVFETKESLAGQEEMFDEENEEPESTDAPSSDDSDVEEIELKDTNGIQASSDAEEEDSLSIDESLVSIDRSSHQEKADEELAAFDAKLAQALKTRPLNADLSASTAASSPSSSDEDMDDAQMEALDSHIAAIFRERKKSITGTKSKKSQQKDAKETIVNFKCRVLELLEIFVKQQHRRLVSLELLMPLLTVTRTTTSQLVSSRACNLVREFSRVCKGKEMPETDDVAMVVKLLKGVHGEAMREASNAHASACSQASLLLVRLLVAMDRENLRKVVKVYASTQEALLMDPKCRVKISFFTDWMNWCATARLGR